ncbi:MAG TPA: PAS domain S-box protein [Gemmatimonadaceae bacterium]|nr:PAS domain S-box protein [Gemmatimonadaceae bacterium]
MNEPVARARGSLRTSIMAFGVAAVVYVAILGLLVRLAVQPASTRLRQSSQAVLQEYRESAVRAGTMSATITSLWRLHEQARTQPVTLDSLEALRYRVEKLAETSRTMHRLAAAAGAASNLRLELAEALVYEDRLRSEMLGAIASLELGEYPVAERMLRRADSLSTPLDESLNSATAMALQEMTAHEDNLARALSAMTTVVWIWLLGGMIALGSLALFLQRRLNAPLVRLDEALDRVSVGDLGLQLIHPHQDELGRLAAQFNRMTAMLRQRALDDERRAEDRTAARTRLILDAALDAVVVADAAGVIKEWSPQAEQVFGWTRAEVIDQRLADTIVPHEHRQAHTDGLERFGRTGTGPFVNRRLELAALRKDGTRFPIEITITPLRRGSHTEFSAFIRDITERKRAQAAIAESEARYRAAFEQAAVGMVEVGLDGRYLRVNQAFAELVGRPASSIIGMTIAELSHPDDREADSTAFTRMVAGLEPVRRQKRYLRPDGTVAICNLAAALVRDSSGAPLYAVTVAQDVTAQRRLEEELRQAHKMEAVGQLAGGIAHDFNNLLTAIIGYADLLRSNEGTSAAIQDDASAIKATAARGAELARNLLTLARTAPSRGEPVDVHQSIIEVRDIAARTFDRRIALRMHLDAQRPIVTGDRSLLTNAFLNLALNARDAMPDGGELTITTTERELGADECVRLAGVVEPGPFLVVRVEDTGTGMTPSVQQRAFEPFFTNKPMGKGTGIGLSMVYGTVRSHSGAIELHSQLGRGTSFTIYLPLRAEEAEGQEPVVPLVVTGSGRILLADDDDTVRDVARRMLQEMGYEVDCAADGAEAVERVASDPVRYQLAILDGNMPKLHGRDAATSIRQLAPDLPLVLSTGYLEPDDSDILAGYGFSGFIAKPYSMSDLSRLVAQQMSSVK